MVAIIVFLINITARIVYPQRMQTYSQLKLGADLWLYIGIPVHLPGSYLNDTRRNDLDER